MKDSVPYDLLVVGGGINGAGIARDAAGRGLKVLLCEQDDLAAYTSSASSKLIHGGLRYLEHYEFGLVRKALIEREVLLRQAPHIIQPLRFVMPHWEALRPAWMIRLGLLLYDYLDLGKRKLLAGSHGIKLRKHPAGAPLNPSFVKGFVYSDGWVDDARMVVLNALDAAERGAKILTRTRCVAAQREGKLWKVKLQATDANDSREVHARCLVNAAGPWAMDFLNNILNLTGAHRRNIRLVKGSHIVVRKLFDHEYAYIFQNPDKRVIFALPYEKHYTLIGTTDVEYEGDPAKVAVSPEEITYLCQSVNHYFLQEIHPQDVVWSYSGVRPLVDDESQDASAVTRDYVLELDTQAAPLLSVLGGKLTTFRKLAEEVVDQLKAVLDFSQPAWTGQSVPLPGGDIPGADFDTFLSRVRRDYAWLPESLARRYARAYGTRITRLLEGAKTLQDLGEHLGENVYALEMDYLIDHEWARSLSDILWRRTKLGLHLSAQTVSQLQNWLDKKGLKQDQQKKPALA